MPSHIVIGAGVNGLSVAWALAERGAEVLVLDKGRIGAGASGIAGGIVRNFYRAEAITELVRLSVEMFEEDAEAYGFRQVGYVAAVPEAQADDLVAIRAQHERAGYESELVTGAESCREYLTWTWPDWEAPVEALLHERRGGWADSMQTIRRLAERARAAGAEIREGVEVVGFEMSGAEVETVVTDAGRIPCGTLVLAPGPWAARLWHLLGLDPYVDVGGERRPLLEYWKAQEGEFALKGAGLSGRAGIEAPVVHLDQAGPLRSDADGSVLAEGAWGIYFRMGRTGTGITGGGLPVLLDDPGLDPYGPTTQSTPPSRPSATSSPRASPARCGAFAAARTTGSSRRRAASSPIRPTTTRSATGCSTTPTRSSIPATASRRSPSGASWPATSQARATRDSSRFASGASPEAPCTRPRRAPILGPERVDVLICPKRFRPRERDRGEDVG